MYPDTATIEEIQRRYKESKAPWYLGYSGGKDSSALLVLLFNALHLLKKCEKPVTIVYSDTGVEIPLLSVLAKSTLQTVKRESRIYNIPFNVKIVKPRIGDTFFVNVIGKGYPPPTNKFRWCTDRLRTNPLQQFMKSVSGDKLVLLGLRKGESKERDKVLNSCETNDKNVYYQVGHANTKIYAPLLHYTTDDVWGTLLNKQLPESIDGIALARLYRSATTNSDLTDCSKGFFARFGCWTCTVVRKDKSVTNMVKHGYHELMPLLHFRDWLYEFRDLPKNRCRWRRNGNRGSGPLTLKARRTILEKLLCAQAKTKWRLITKKEVETIRMYWAQDRSDNQYRE